MLNIAPRYSKTELVIKNFSAYGFAINPASKFIHLSYSADLAMDNSSEVQGTVTSEAFQELFDLELTSESKRNGKPLKAAVLCRVIWWTGYRFRSWSGSRGKR